MKNTRLLAAFATLAATAFSLASARAAGREIGPVPALSFDGPDVVVRWNAAKGVGFELVRTSDLADWNAWSGSVTPSGTDLVAQGPDAGPRTFFRLRPKQLPPAPAPAFRVFDNRFGLQWTHLPTAASYVIYLSTSPGAGPSNFTQIIADVCDNQLAIEGLTPGTRYYLTMVGVNEHGEGQASAEFTGVFGLVDEVMGALSLSCPEKNGTPFLYPLPGVPLEVVEKNTNVVQGATVTTTGGRFVFPAVPPGTYLVRWAAQPPFLAGNSGTFSLTGTQNWSTGQVLVTPDPAATFLTGRTCFADKSGAGFSSPTLGLELRTTVTAKNGGGAVLATTTADEFGRFLIPSLQPGDFPVTLEAAFKSATASLFIGVAGEKGPHEVCFSQTPAKFRRVKFIQAGQIVTEINPSLPVTLMPDVDSGQAPVDLSWNIEGASGAPLGTGTGLSPTFDLSAIGSGTAVYVTGCATTAFTPPSKIRIRIPVTPVTSGPRCLTGTVNEWTSPAEPPAQDVLTGIGNAKIEAKFPSGLNPVVFTSTDGYFEINDSNGAVTALLKISATGHVPLVRHFQRLPQEADFHLIPTNLQNAVIPSNGSPIQVLLPGGHVLTMQKDSVLAAGNPYSGLVSIESGFWRPTDAWNPLLPAPPSKSAGAAVGPRFIAGCWFHVTTPSGQVVTFSQTPPLATLGLAVPASALAANGGFLPGTAINLTRSIVDEATGFFTDDGALIPATLTAHGDRYQLSVLANKVFHALQQNTPGSTLSIYPDRSLNFPFQMFIGNSAVPVTMFSEETNSIDLQLLRLPSGADLRWRLLNLRQAPGAHYPDLTASTLFPPFDPPVLAPYAKQVVADGIVPAASMPAAGEATATVSLGQALSELRSDPALAEIQALRRDNAFLGPNDRYTIPLASDGRSVSQSYFEAIRAPANFAAWKTRNGFPQSIFDPSPTSGIHRIVYYYNLGDLGFARRLSLRKTTGPDGQPNVAMEVTNFHTLDDARCDRSPLAAVCMEYAKYPGDPAEEPRYVKFLAYAFGDNAGALTGSLPLDGGPSRALPNLCVMCHGGRPFEATVAGVPARGNLGSRFLPFDLDSFSYHRGPGLQREGFAQINEAVMATDQGTTPSSPTPGAIAQLIQGWYGTATPTSAPAAFDRDHVPAAWAGEPALYRGAFSHSCRICHISRAEQGGPQFETPALFLAMARRNNSPVCSIEDAGMPAAQRTWGIIWGSRAAWLTAPPAARPGITDFPAQLLGLPSGAALTQPGGGSCLRISR